MKIEIYRRARSVTSSFCIRKSERVLTEGGYKWSHYTWLFCNIITGRKEKS